MLGIGVSFRGGEVDCSRAPQIYRRQEQEMMHNVAQQRATAYNRGKKCFVCLLVCSDRVSLCTWLA